MELETFYAVKPKKVFVSGCYDLLHSGHVEFFRQAAQYGDLYVGIGSDKTYLGYKHRKTIYSEQERLFMVKSIRYVKDAYINAGSGVMDFVPTLDIVKPDVFVVNSDGGSEEKRQCCRERGIEYVELQRDPHEGLTARSSTDLKKTESQIPTRLDLAGTWIDQPYVSCFAPGWAITISLEPTFEVRERCGLSTSTRNMIRKIWPYQLPNMDLRPWPSWCSALRMTLNGAMALSLVRKTALASASPAFAATITTTASGPRRLRPAMTRTSSFGWSAIW